jgi:hypothetical protein
MSAESSLVVLSELGLADVVNRHHDLNSIGLGGGGVHDDIYTFSNNKIPMAASKRFYDLLTLGSDPCTFAK